MLFNSMDFLIFFPAVVLIYFLIPDRIKHWWLLAASYYFYMSWDAKYGLLILFCTICTYFCGLVVENSRENKKKTYLCTAICIVLAFSMLAYYKYTGFTLNTLEQILKQLGITWKAPAVNIILPVGISFFTFQAVSYVIDVYRGDIYAEKDFSRIEGIKPAAKE